MEFIFSTLKGEVQNPQFSAVGNHASMMEPFTEPLVYRNRLLAPKVFIQYNFIINDYNNVTNPFIRAGVGFLPYLAELRYKNRWDDGMIFGKGLEEYEKNKMTTAVYTITPGISTKISKNLGFMAAISLNLVNYDFLDVVHNYNLSGERLQVKGIYADFMVGIIVLFNDSGKFDTFTKRHSKDGKTRDTLPFYERRRK